MARSQTLLSICQEAIEDVDGFDIPSTIINNDDPTAVALKRAARKTGRELAAKVRWQALLSASPYTFSTIASNANYDLPSDYGQFAHVTEWDATQMWELLGPASPALWQWLQNATIASGIRYWFRVSGNYFQLFPTPTAVGTISYAYYSRYYCTNSGGTAIEDWASDTDLSRIDSELFILGIAYYFRRAKGMPYGAEQADYMQGILDYQSNDSPKGVVDFAAGINYRAMGVGNLPETGFGA